MGTGGGAAGGWRDKDKHEDKDKGKSTWVLGLVLPVIRGLVLGLHCWPRWGPDL